MHVAPWNRMNVKVTMLIQPPSYTDIFLTRKHCELNSQSKKPEQRDRPEQRQDFENPILGSDLWTTVGLDLRSAVELDLNSDLMLRSVGLTVNSTNLTKESRQIFLLEMLAHLKNVLSLQHDFGSAVFHIKSGFPVACAN